MKLRLERKNTGDLLPYDTNSKHHNDEDVSAIMRSIERFGFNDPIAVTTGMVIIEGHGRHQAAQNLGIEAVPVMVIEGLTEDQYDLYRIAHNKIALTSQFDFAALFSALQDVVGEDGISYEDMGFNDAIVGNLFQNFGEADPEEEGESRAADSGALSYEVIWEDKEQKELFKQFLADEDERGADKAMGSGEVFMAMIQRDHPEIWEQLCLMVPGTISLDHQAGIADEEVEHEAA